MDVKLNAYINFRDTTRQAMEFYQSVFGGKLVLLTYKEYNSSPSPEEDDKIMHAMLDNEEGISFMASDTPNSMPLAENSTISLSLGGSDEAKLRDYYSKLSEEGQVIMPLAQSPWGDTFGMCKDKHGVAWLINIAAKR